MRKVRVSLVSGSTRDGSSSTRTLQALDEFARPGAADVEVDEHVLASTEEDQ